MSHTLSRSRRITYTIIVAVLVMLAVETMSQLTFRALYDHSYRPNKLQDFTTTSWIPEGAAALPPYLRSLVIHPYVGFVFDVPAHASPGLGFDEQFSPAESRRSRDHLRILALGGSVAAQVMSASQADGTSYLKKALVSELEKKGMDVDLWMFNATLTGGKQPQQLMAYTYLLTQSAEFDLVVNLDGFNEMTLAFEGKPRGLHPAYPRSWDVMVGGRLTAGNLRNVGELLLLREKQNSLVEFAQSTLLARSAVIGLFMAHRLIELDRHVRDLVEETEYRKIQGELSFEQGGIPFAYENNEATYRYLAALWRRSSLILWQLAASNNTEYLHIFQPNQYVKGSKVLTQQERDSFFVPDAGLGIYYTVLYPYFRDEIDALLKHGEWFVDATMIYKEEIETVYSDRCCHFNHRGLEQLAAFIAREIVSGSSAVRAKAGTR